jgi:hypothetical protein
LRRSTPSTRSADALRSRHRRSPRRDTAGWGSRRLAELSETIDRARMLPVDLDLIQAVVNCATSAESPVIRCTSGATTPISGSPLRRPIGDSRWSHTMPCSSAAQVSTFGPSWPTDQRLLVPAAVRIKWPESWSGPGGKALLPARVSALAVTARDCCSEALTVISSPGRSRQSRRRTSRSAGPRFAYSPECPPNDDARDLQAPSGCASGSGGLD